MKLLLALLFLPSLLSAQVLDSARTYKSEHTDSVKAWYTRTITKTDTLRLPAMTALTVSPTGVSLAVGKTQAFLATAVWSDNVPHPFTPSWSATGGVISQTGLYTAGPLAGAYRVCAQSGAFMPCVDLSLIVPPPPTPPPTPPPAGVTIAPGENWQTKVNAYPAGTVFRILAGTHVRQTVVPKTSDQLIADSGAVMDGQNLTQFAIWEGSAPYPDNVVIQGLEIKNYVPPTQLAAVRMNSFSTVGGRNWIVRSNNIHDNANIGLRLGPGGQALSNNVHHNGTLGMSAVGDGTASTVLVQSNEIHHNNPSGAGLGFESGGTKFVKTNGLILRSNNVHDNKGPGLWLDIGNRNFLVELNTVDDNMQEGIVIEISYNGTIQNNTVRRNGLDDARASFYPWGSGIGIHASGGTGIVITGNLLQGNAHGIALIQQGRGTNHPNEPAGIDPEMYVQNVNAHDNTITLQTVAGHLHPGSFGASEVVQDVGLNAIFTSRNNVFTNNTYTLNGKAFPFAWLNGYRNSTYWIAIPQDATGTFNP